MIKNRKKKRKLIHQSVPSKVLLKSLQAAAGGKIIGNRINVKHLMP